MEVMELELIELQESVNEVNVIGLDEVISQIEDVILSMNDVVELLILIFGFIVGYIVVRDFINNIMKSV